MTRYSHGQGTGKKHSGKVHVWTRGRPKQWPVVRERDTQALVKRLKSRLENPPKN